MSELTSEGFLEGASATDPVRDPRVPEGCALALLLLLEEDADFEGAGAGSSSLSLSFSFSFMPKRDLIAPRFLNVSFTLEAIEEPAEVIEFVMVFMMFLGFFGGILVCGSIMVIPATRPLYMS